MLLPVVEQLKLREDPEFSKRGSLLGGPQAQGEQAELSSLLEKLEKALQVKRVGKTHIIEVLFTAQSPEPGGGGGKRHCQFIYPRSSSGEV